MMNCQRLLLTLAAGLFGVVLVFAPCGLSGCSGSNNPGARHSVSENDDIVAGSAANEDVQANMGVGPEEEEGVMRVMVTVNGEAFAATLADTDAAREFAGRLEDGTLVLHLDDYSGFEKVGELGFALTTSEERITTQAGDIVLYQGDQVVLFYGSNTWAYTRLARIDDLDGWESALGGGGVDVTFALSD